MGSALIPLQVQPPQIQDPATALKTVYSIKDLQAQQEARQQQAQLNQQKIQEIQLQRATSQAINSAMQQNTRMNPDGSVRIDYDGVARSMAQKGWGSAIPGFLGDAAKAQQAQAKVLADNLENQGKATEQFSQQLQDVKDDAGYQRVRPHLDAITGQLRQMGINEPAPPTSFDAGYVATKAAQGMKIADALAKHRLAVETLRDAPKTADEWRKLADNLFTRTSSDDQWGATIAALKAKGMPTDLLDTYGNSYSEDKINAIQDANLSGAERDKANRQRLQDAAINLAQAKTFQDAQNRYNALSPSLQSQFTPPVEKGFDPDDWRSSNLEVGQTPNEVVTSDATEARNQRLTAHEAVSERQAQERIDAMRDRNSATRGQTANSQAVDQRQGLNDYRKLEIQERNLNRQRESLGNLMKSGQEIIDPKTGVKRNLQQEFDEVTDELSQVLADKYNAASRAHMGTPTVSLEQSLSNIGRGGKSSAPASGPGPGQASVAPPPSASPKKYSEAEIRQRAAAKGIDPDQAVANARKNNLLQ